MVGLFNFLNLQEVGLFCAQIAPNKHKRVQAVGM
jgi:hypothetical protein